MTTRRQLVAGTGDAPCRFGPVYLRGVYGQV